MGGRDFEELFKEPYSQDLSVGTEAFRDELLEHCLELLSADESYAQFNEAKRMHVAAREAANYNHVSLRPKAACESGKRIASRECAHPSEKRKDTAKALVVGCGATAQQALGSAIAEMTPYVKLAICADMAEVLALPSIEDFDVAFIGLGVLDARGATCACELRRLNPNMSFIFVSDANENAGHARGTQNVGFFMKPITAESVADELRSIGLLPTKSARTSNRLFVRCFGEFEVFADGNALKFKRAKSKELLAFLVDRRGAVVSMRSIEAALWEEAPKSIQSSGSYLRTLVSDLRQALEACGHADALVRRSGELGVDATKMTCDYYDYLRGDPSAINRWRGEYMAQYAWAESTRAALQRN